MIPPPFLPTFAFFSFNLLYIFFFFSFLFVFFLNTTFIPFLITLRRTYFLHTFFKQFLHTSYLFPMYDIDGGVYSVQKRKMLLEGHFAIYLFFNCIISIMNMKKNCTQHLRLPML